MTAAPATDRPTGYPGVLAAHIAGITYRQLDYWARTDFVCPEVKSAAGSGSRRLYSVRDIVLLAVVRDLLHAGAMLDAIRTAIAPIRTHTLDDLADITLLADGTTAYLMRSDDEVLALIKHGACFAVSLGGVVAKVAHAIDVLTSTRVEVGR